MKGLVEMESVQRRKDGSTFPVELSLTRVQLEGGYVVVVARDVTERKQAEERLREYERVVEGLEERILVVDRKYRYVIANRAFLHHRGLRGNGSSAVRSREDWIKRFLRLSVSQRWTNVSKAKWCNMN